MTDISSLTACSWSTSQPGQLGSRLTQNSSIATLTPRDVGNACAEARTANLDHAARHFLRSKKAPALLADIKAVVTTARITSLPASALAKAANYTLALWPKLTRFLEYPELELSNNLAENSMRPVALGRKNWIHIGSEQAGPKVAAILSVVETCRRSDIPVREYLAAALPGLAETPVHRLPQLTPIVWASENR